MLPFNELPFNELRFNIAFRILITLYGFSGLGSFFARMPKEHYDDDKIFHCSHYSYTFRLITSLIFFLIGLSQFKYQTLIFLTAAEIFIIIIVYIKPIINKQKYLKKQSKKIASKIKETKERFL